MSEIVRARVEERLTRLRLGSVASRLDTILSQAARKEPTYLDFLDGVLGDELDAKQKKRVAMGIQIAHFPTVKLLEEFDFKFQPSFLLRDEKRRARVARVTNAALVAMTRVGLLKQIGDDTDREEVIYEALQGDARPA